MNTDEINNIVMRHGKQISEINSTNDIIKEEFENIIQKIPFDNIFKYHSIYNTQKFIPMIENEIIKRSNSVRNVASLENGDMTKDDKTYEIKITILTKTNPKANIVQIRPKHIIDFYIVFVYDSIFDKLNVFKLTSFDMKTECDIHNACAAHGKKKTATELRMSLSKDDLLSWKKYETKYENI